MIDKPTAQALRTEAQSLTICGQCKSSTFILWQLASLKHAMDPEAIRRYEERRGITGFESKWIDSESGTRAGMIVRCAFFRMNVPDPLGIVDCEGFKPRRGHS